MAFYFFRNPNARSARSTTNPKPKTLSLLLHILHKQNVPEILWRSECDLLLVLCVSKIPTRAPRARPRARRARRARAERVPSARRARRARGARRACVLVSHEKQTSPKASLNFKGSLQHPNLSLPPAFYTNSNARLARSSIQLKTKTWNITLQKESIAEMLWSSEPNIALHLFCLSTNPKKALSELGQNKP